MTISLWTYLLGAGILAVAAIAIFVATRKRKTGSKTSKFTAENARFIILVGSENGTTTRLATSVYEHLLAGGQSVFLTTLNNYQSFPQAEQLIVMTSTYGSGEAPGSAKRFMEILPTVTQSQKIHFSVMAFGSRNYPDFCRFGYDVHLALTNQEWAVPFLDIHTIDDKSPEQSDLWMATWFQQIGLPKMALPEYLTRAPLGLKPMTIISRTEPAHTDGAFSIRIKTSSSFTSGDLLAIYPGGDYRERQYSIGKVDKEIQLSVKLHPNGFGSGYLYALNPGDVIHARVIANYDFRFPSGAPRVIMIANGTGIAPFLGMMDQNKRKTECHLYCGFRGASSFALYDDFVKQQLAGGQLSTANIAYSREGDKQYVKDLLARDADLIATTLHEEGTIMICGSLAMQHDVVQFLDALCMERYGKSLSHYESHGQVLMDCY
ncbi:NADPH cytochrome P450 oxidoreductase family protein [Chitinophaga horti]|uniref:NADPH cytochrome P450 oxidoreductase family protein n=1 Tax=Chitinophaga horti TaxID=2920382 RepID=A0ABY6JBL3_9BACT|nr:NADPH cytochrome P450 oxidoreductase family protein [Chitinophaga horti]UYQ95699.1 NADPH cytochrome P450 oxidoreductase family protein [Chitinophaga horti]